MSQRFVQYIHFDGKAWPNYFVDPKTGFIYFIQKINNRKIVFSTKEKTGIKAKNIANKRLEKILGRKRYSTKTLIVDELQDWLKVKASEGLAYDTSNNVKRAAKQIEEFWGSKYPSEITLDTLAEWYAWWKKNYPDSQMENVVKYMRNFCKYLATKTIDGHPVLPAVPKIIDPNREEILIQRKKKKERIFTVDEFQKIYRAASNIEEQVLCLFMYTMATRVDETLNLEFDTHVLMNQDPPMYRWFIGSNKADLDGRHALHPSLIGPLKTLRTIRMNQRTKRLFPQKFDNKKPLRAQQIDWDGWRARAGLDWHWTSHTFRHTCLSNLFNNESLPQATICKQYRVSLAVALDTYVKTTTKAMMKIFDTIEVKL